jgi:hypothetical protein
MESKPKQNVFAKEKNIEAKFKRAKILFSQNIMFGMI